MLLGLWVRAGVLDVHHATGTEPTAAQLAPELDTGQPLRHRRLPLLDALAENPRAFALMIAMRLGEMFSIYLVVSFALSYSTNTLGWSRDSSSTWAWWWVASVLAFPFFWAMQGHRLLLTMVIAVLLVNVGHDMMVAVQQPIFTDLFGARYRYSGAGFGSQVAAVVAGGFTPFIASWLVHATGSWHSVAAYLLAGCLVSAVVGAVARHPEPQLVVLRGPAINGMDLRVDSPRLLTREPSTRGSHRAAGAGPPAALRPTVFLDDVVQGGTWPRSDPVRRRS